MSCLDASAVQGYVEGSLGEAERAHAEAHLDSCESCRRLVAALALTTSGQGIATMATQVDGLEPRGNAPQVGATIDRYRLDEYLGHGGMGIVYKAHDPELKRDVAIKLLRAQSSHAGEDGLQARLLREAQAMAQVAHPNVIAVYDVGTWQGEVFLAMELATAGTLRGWAKQRPPAEIIDAFCAAGRGLAAAHAVGLVHRDFKPDNVLVGADGRVRVTDFGLARPHGGLVEAAPALPSVSIADLTLTGAVMGTPGYIAPEVFDNDPADARSDQFAFCVALWEALYGRRPFAGSNARELAEAARAGKLVDPPAVRGVPRAVAQALRRGLDPRPEARWPSMDALLAELERRDRRAPWLAAAGLIAIAAATIAAVAWWPHGSATQQAGHAGDAGADAVDPETAREIAQLKGQLSRLEAAREAGDFTTADRLGLQVIEQARAHHLGAMTSAALADHGQTLNWMDDLAGSERDLREARMVAEANGEDPMKTQMSTRLADLLDREGKHEEADDVRRLALATTSRRATESSRVSAFEAEAAAASDVDTAREKWNAAFDVRRKGVSSFLVPAGVAGAISGLAHNRKGLAISLARFGQLDEARDMLLSSLPMVRAMPKGLEASASELLLTLTLAFVDLQVGKCDDAEVQARRSLEVGITQIHRNEPLASTSQRAIAEALLCLGKRDAAEQEFTTALSGLATRPLQRASALAAMASVELAYGAAGDAVGHADTALDVLAKTPGDPMLTARVQVLLCRALVADHQTHRVRELPACSDDALVRRASDRAAERRGNTWLEYPEPPLLRQ